MPEVCPWLEAFTVLNTILRAFNFVLIPQGGDSKDMLLLIE